MHPSGVYLFKMYIYRPHNTIVMIIASLIKAKGAQSLHFWLVNPFSLAPSPVSTGAHYGARYSLFMVSMLIEFCTLLLHSIPVTFILFPNFYKYELCCDEQLQVHIFQRMKPELKILFFKYT